MEQSKIALYGAQVNRQDLKDAVYSAEVESLHARTMEGRVVLNRETGELHTEWYPAGRNSVTDRTHDGRDVVLYHTTSKHGWSPFCDWYRDGLLDSDLDEFVVEALGKDVRWEYRNVYLENLGDDEPEPLWSWALDEYGCQEELDDEVVRKCTDDLMCDFDPEEIVNEIVKEAERNA